jgi:chemotaxis response regulator CheB
LGGLPCAEAKEGETLAPGRIYLAPGDRHLLVDATRGGLLARLTTDPPENFCRPSVDPMLRSAAAACDGRVLVAMLTGMGQDQGNRIRNLFDRPDLTVARLGANRFYRLWLVTTGGNDGWLRSLL